MLDEIVRDYKVKLDPNIFDYDQYEKDLELELKNLNDATDNFNSNNNTGNINGNNSTYLEEKCRNLELQLKNRDNEIEILKKNLYGDNQIEQRVVIDYLKDQLKTEKEKYENYLNYTLKENKLLMKKNEQIINDRIESRKRLYSHDTNNLKTTSYKDKKKLVISIGNIKVKNNNNNYKRTTKTTKKYS